MVLVLKHDFLTAISRRRLLRRGGCTVPSGLAGEAPGRQARALPILCPPGPQPDPQPRDALPSPPVRESGVAPQDRTPRADQTSSATQYWLDDQGAPAQTAGGGPGPATS